MQRYGRVEEFRKISPWPKPVTEADVSKGAEVLEIFSRMRTERGMDDVDVFIRAGFGSSYELFAAFRFGPHTCPEQILDFCRTTLEPNPPPLAKDDPPA